MDKVSYYFKIFKELWGNKRYRALIIIGCYVLFFGFVLISLNTPGENKPIEEITPLKKNTQDLSVSTQLENDDEYKIKYLVNEGTLYEYIYNKDLTLLKIDNTYYKVYYNVLTPYDIKTGLELSGDSPSFVVKFWRFNKEIIGKMMKNAEVINVNGDVTTYSIPSLFIIENINASLPILYDSKIKTTSILFDVKVVNKEVVHVKLDLTDYYHLYSDSTDTYQLDLEFEGK